MIAFKIVDVNGQSWYELTDSLVCENTGIEGYYFRNAVISIEYHGVLTLSPGFRWDGRSGPTVNTVSTLRSSAIHDALYELITIEALPQSTRLLADVLMRRIDKEDGVGIFRRWYSHIALRLFGRGRRDYITSQPSH